jgi:hypothetical protein
MEGKWEDDGAEDPAASSTQHQLRASSSRAASPGGARLQHGGSGRAGSRAGALANPRHGGGAAAATPARGRGSWRARLAKYLFCIYVHAMNIFLLIEFKCQLWFKNQDFCLKIMLTDSNLVATNIYNLSSKIWSSLVQRNRSILHFCCMRLSDLVSKCKIATNQCCVMVTYCHLISNILLDFLWGQDSNILIDYKAFSPSKT